MDPKKWIGKSRESVLQVTSEAARKFEKITGRDEKMETNSLSTGIGYIKMIPPRCLMIFWLLSKTPANFTGILEA